METELLVIRINKKRIMRNIIFVLATIFSFSGTTLAQSNSNLQASKEARVWKTLSKITFKKQYDEMLGFKVDVPVFSDDVLELENKVVEVKGYIIPIEGYKSHTEFVFSAYPYNMCFFCGGAGPETVMEVYTKEPIEYTAEPIIIRGKLELNGSDINRLIYALQDAEMVRKVN